jgi:hypothetical protein
LLFGSLATLAVLLSPAAVSARLSTLSIERHFEPASGIETESTAQAAGSRVGRIPKCSKEIIRGVRPPFNRHEREKLKRFSRCLNNGPFRAANQLVKVFVVALVHGDGALACLLLTPTERQRVGGVGCVARFQDVAPLFAARNPFIALASVQFFGKHRQGEYVVRFDNPSDGVLLELEVVHNHWRISDTNDLLP